MKSRDLLTLGVLALTGYVAYEYYLESTADTSGSETDAADNAINSGTGILQTIYENMLVTTGLTNWKNVGQGPTYVPILNAAELQYNIPTDLLARIAYQESHFRSDIISGATVSPAGAIGIMQLMPQYFPGAGQNPEADIATAAKYLASLYNEFGDWQIAVAAYNDGPGNVQGFLNGSRQLPQETVNYVASVFADVPVQGQLIQVA
jgi:soluble lytic murein transglycosylase-like protein